MSGVPADYSGMTIRDDLTVSFYDEGEQLGVFKFGERPAKFEGKAACSAEIFIESVLQLWDQYYAEP